MRAACVKEGHNLAWRIGGHAGAESQAYLVPLLSKLRIAPG